jgi:hypothetical protein
LFRENFPGPQNTDNCTQYLGNQNQVLKTLWFSMYCPLELPGMVSLTTPKHSRRLGTLLANPKSLQFFLFLPNTPSSYKLQFLRGLANPDSSFTCVHRFPLRLLIVQKLTFLLKIDGTLMAPDGPKAWKEKNGKLDSWVIFKSITGMSLQVSGLTDGRGEKWWGTFTTPRDLKR